MKIKRYYPLIVLLLIILFFLAYGGEIFGGLINNSKGSVENIVLYPNNSLAKQLEINAQVVKENENYYAKDEAGYKIELLECTNNRDLVLDQKQKLKGFILSVVDPKFICGVYIPEQYQQRLLDIRREDARLKEFQRTQEIQKNEETSQKIVIENKRKEIENEYDLRLAKLYKGLSRDEVESILDLRAVNCEFKSWDRADQCNYQKIINEKYKFSLIIIYKNGFMYYTGYSVTTI